MAKYGTPEFDRVMEWATGDLGRHEFAPRLHELKLAAYRLHRLATESRNTTEKNYPIYPDDGYRQAIYRLAELVCRYYIGRVHPHPTDTPPIPMEVFDECRREEITDRDE